MAITVPTGPATESVGPRTKHVLGGPLLSLAVLLGMCVGLETLARIARAIQGPRPTKADIGKQFEYDPLLGWRKRPGFRMLLRQPEYSVDLSINSHGLRDPERGFEAPPGTLRVLALGDSFVEAYFVPMEESLTRVLEVALRRSGHSVEVVNGGTAGYSTDQEYLFYETEGTKYAPRVVLLFFCDNDVLYNGRNRAYGRAKPLLMPQPDGSLRPNRYPVRRTREEEPEDAAPSSGDPWGSAFLGWVQDRSHAHRRLYNRLADLGLWAPLPLHKGVPLEMRVYERRSVPELEPSWERTDRILEALARDTAARGMGFLVAYVPSRMEVDDGAWALTKDLYNIDDGNWDRHRVVERLRGFGADHGFSVVDLTPSLRSAGPGTYYQIDEHWTALGQRVAAQELARILESRGWLSAAAAGPFPQAPATSHGASK